MDDFELAKKYEAWLKNREGEKPDLSEANLRYADLSYADLSGANLSEASLSYADLSYADLSGANLRYANLRGADLSDVNLSDANLSGANLSCAKGIKWAACGWHGHGEYGRQLLAVEINLEIRFFCGYFRGNEAELKAYIANGKEQYKASRTKAMEFCLSCFED